jgi:hypothetical protein
MIKSVLKNFKGGWIIGNFEPSLINTKNFEIAIKKIKKGFVDIPHYHIGGAEYNILISGKLIQNTTEIFPEEIFIFEAGEVAKVEAIEDSIVIAIRGYSDPSDKYEII